MDLVRQIWIESGIYQIVPGQIAMIVVCLLLLYLGIGALLPVRRWKWFAWIASSIFYGYWDWRFLALIWASTIIDYVVAQKISAAELPGAKKRWLKVSIFANLGFLGFFKYFNFFIESFESAFSIFGADFDFLHLNIILPVGISFYTFQSTIMKMR